MGEAHTRQMYCGGQKVCLVFSVRGLQQCLAIFNFIRNSFVRLYCDSHHIGIKKSKLVNFCVAISILKIEEDTQHFQRIMLSYFKKRKNATESQKKVCAVYGQDAVTDQMCQKWFAKFLGVFCQIILCCGAVLCIGRCLAAPVASTHYFGQQWGDSQRTQNIQINKGFGENEKCVFYFTGKKLTIFSYMSQSCYQ